MNEAQVENHITASVTTPDPSKTVWAVWIPILCTVTGLLGGGVAWGVSQYISWQSRISDQQKAVADENKRLLNEYLLPVQAKLKLNRSTYTQLSDPRFSEPGYGILESYVEKSKHERDPKKLALQFGLITDLVQQDNEISDLLEKYGPFRLNKAFIMESDKFLEHANIYKIRFRALPNLTESGGTLPLWKPFPEGFPSALEDEIATRRSERPATNHEFDVVVRLPFRSGSPNPEDCESAMRGVQVDYPGAILTTSPPKELSRRAGRMSQNAEYNYACTIHVQRPISVAN